MAFMAGLTLCAHVGAATISFDLTQSNLAGFPNGTPYLELTIFDGADAAGKNVGSYTALSSDVVFELTPLTALTQQAHNKFGVVEFAFNTTELTSLYSTANFKLPAGWSASTGPANESGFGKFDLVTLTHGANGAQNPLWFALTGLAGDSAATYTDLSSGHAGLGNVDFVAHVVNFCDGEDGSGWFGGGTPVGTVPIPISGWLLLTGLMALLGAGTRRRPLGFADRVR